MKPILINLIVMMSLLFPVHLDVQAQSLTAAGWQRMAQVGGPIQGIAVQGSYAYLGYGARLLVVNISNPANPVEVGATAPFDYFVRGVAVSGTLAFVAAGASGLHVINIANPAAPVEVGAWKSTGFAEGLAVKDQFVYLANGPYGLRVIDVSNPAAPVEVAHAFEMEYIYDVALNGRFAALAGGGAGLLLVDVLNPLLPLEQGRCDTTGYAYSVTAAGSYAYVADGWGGLKVINTIDPLHPVLSSSLAMQGWAFDISISGSLAYVAGAFKGLRVVNISSPLHPSEVGGVEWAQSAVVGAAVVGTRVYLADRKNGLRVINASNPANPEQVGLLTLMDFARYIVVGGNYAYLAAGFRGLRIFDISNPARPVEVAVYQINGFVHIVYLTGNRLYFGTMTDSPEMGIFVLDVSDPTHPVLISHFENLHECRAIDVVGNVGYFADSNGMRIVDFSNLKDPVEVGDTHRYASALVVRNGLAYAMEGGDGLKVYNVTNPANISQVGVFNINSSYLVNMKVVGSLLYVSDNDRMRVLSLANPLVPSELATFATSGRAEWLEVVNNKAYLAEGISGVEVVDVSNPLNMQRLSGYDSMAYTQAIAVSGGRLFVADNSGALVVLSPVSGMPPATPPVRPKAPDAPMMIRLPSQTLPSRLSETSAPQPESRPRAARAAGTCMVTSAADSGSGSLRNCLQDQANGDVITFSTAVFPPAHPTTIYLFSGLPSLDQGNVSIDASNAGVILDGSNVVKQNGCAWNSCAGLIIQSNGNIVRGLQIHHFPEQGIVISAGNNNLIGGSRLAGSAPTGQGNMLSGNPTTGIVINDGSQGNRVLGNLIGVDAAGTHTLPNQVGININNSTNTTIGSLKPGEDNIISGNDDTGIILYGFTTSGTAIIGNKIGTDISGTVSLGNRTTGIFVECGSFNNLVQGNLVSGTGFGNGGIVVFDMSSDFNTVIGNKVGTDISGTQPISNATTAVGVGYADYTRIGGSEPGEGNLIYGNSGIFTGGPFSADYYVLGNQVGLNIAGSGDPGFGSGISMSDAPRVILGGTRPGEGNSIFTYQNAGLWIGSDYNILTGNRVGVTADGSPPLRSGDPGVWLDGKFNLLQANQIAFSGQRGIWLPGPVGNTLRRNSIHDNPFDGILLVDGGNGNQPAPVVSLDSSGGSGTTCPGCTVELFLDTGKEGRMYLADVVADESGAFQFPMHCPVPYPNLTATATNGQGSTSQFSDPLEVPWNCSAERPEPTLIEIDPFSGHAPSTTLLLTVTGTGFFVDSIVRWDGMPLPTTYQSSTILQAIIPSHLLQEGGSMLVTIYTPSPGGGESAALPFTILPALKNYLPHIFR